MIPGLRRIAPQPFRHVVIYKGHEHHPMFGPYPDNIPKRVAMFECLNDYRKESGKRPWKVELIAGEKLVAALKTKDPRTTLLVIPAGQSTRLDHVFSKQETEFLRRHFFEIGGRGYFNCGSAYWVSEKRIYKDLCEEQPENAQPIVKTTQLPLFSGIAEGPLCAYPGKKYRVGFFSDAVKVANGPDECTIYLSGGGSFVLPKTKKLKERISVLAKYLPSELARHGKSKEEFAKWENAVIMTTIGKGAALLSMFHPYYGPSDIDVERYEQAFPDCGTDWRQVKERLSPLDTRMRFVLNHMLNPLEKMHFA